MKSFRKILISLVAIMWGFSTLLFAADYPKVKVALYGALNWQALDGSGMFASGASDGFDNPVVNGEIFGQLQENIDFYTEYYLVKKDDPGTFLFSEGYIVFKGLPDDKNVFGLNVLLEKIDVKMGLFELDFGNTHKERSDGGNTINNPLIGNYLVDPVAKEAGVQVNADCGLFHW